MTYKQILLPIAALTIVAIIFYSFTYSIFSIIFFTEIYFAQLQNIENPILRYLNLGYSLFPILIFLLAIMALVIAIIEKKIERYFSNQRENESRAISDKHFDMLGDLFAILIVLGFVLMFLFFLSPIVTIGIEGLSIISFNNLLTTIGIASIPIAISILR